MQRQFKDIIDFMLDQNRSFIENESNETPITALSRKEAAEKEQQPYAVIVTCADSRLPVENIFSAGIGQLFVIRTVGNVVGDYELAGIEYGASYLGAKIIMVLGHSYCGAVGAALDDTAEGFMQSVIAEIKRAIGDEKDPRKCEILNALYTAGKLTAKSQILADLVQKEKIAIVAALYDIESGLIKLIE